MKKNIILFISLFFSINFYSQEIDFNSLPKYDCSNKKWIEFTRDTIIVVKPQKQSNSVEYLLQDLYAFMNNKYIIKNENELNENDLKKSLLIVGNTSDFKKWDKFNLPIKKRKKGFIFNDIIFFDKQDALWFNDYKRVVIIANNYSALKTIFDFGQLGMDFFTLQKNQLSYFGNFIDNDFNKVNSSNVRDLRIKNYILYNESSANFYISKDNITSIDFVKINNNLRDYINKYVTFFEISIPKRKVNAIIHHDLNEMSNMIGMWSLSCGGNSNGMNVLGEIHCIGVNQGLINHEISHHIFNSNIPAENLPPLLLEGVVEVFTNNENHNLYKKRIHNIYNNWTKFDFQELFERKESFYGSNSSLNYELSGVWVKYFIENHGLNTFKKLCYSNNKIEYIESLTNESFQKFNNSFKTWLKIKIEELK
ncbi:hypothetical protein [Wenyingzhuangia sp. IMCC45467]